MFTGIIQDIGTIETIAKDGDWRVRIQTSISLSNKPIGASIACSGCCLTILDKGDNWFDVEISAESLSKTNLRTWSIGSKINIEPSLCVGDELGGHIVSGHVDGVAKLLSITPDKDSHILRLSLPSNYTAFIAQKGSITLDGISLTINDVQDNEFEVNIISHTWAVTTIGSNVIGDEVNFEIDMLARYMMRQMQYLKT